MEQLRRSLKKLSSTAELQTNSLRRAITLVKGRQPFTVKEPFGPVYHSKETDESHSISTEHKVVSKKKKKKRSSPVVRGINLSIISPSPASKNSKRATCGSGAAGCRPMTLVTAMLLICSSPSPNTAINKRSQSTKYPFVRTASRATSRISSLDRRLILGVKLNRCLNPCVM